MSLPFLFILKQKLGGFIANQKLPKIAPSLTFYKFSHFIFFYSESEKTLGRTWMSYCRGSRNLRYRVECWFLRLWSTAPWPSQSVQPVMDKHSWLELTMDKDASLWSHTRRLWEKRWGFKYVVKDKGNWGGCWQEFDSLISPGFRVYPCHHHSFHCLIN